MQAVGRSLLNGQDKPRDKRRQVSNTEVPNTEVSNTLPSLTSRLASKRSPLSLIKHIK
jgi:hypothetical protein